MEELKNLLIEKVGLDAEQGENVVQTVLGFLTDKLPENMQGMAEGLLNGETPDISSLMGGDGEGGNPLEAAKNLFGG